jgi:ABC-type multidrug transport system ATPase subunit/pSer/pThr/pTyr-binding forkhead associated (FHA) protein
MMQYPALLDQATQALHPLGSSESFLVGRNETADVFVADRSCSRHHFRIVRRDGRYYVEPLSARNPTLCNGQVVTGALPLEHGAIIQAGTTLFQLLLQRPRTATGARPPSAAPAVPAVPGSTELAAAPNEVLEVREFPLAGEMIVGRDATQAQILLPRPQVSRRHACLALQGQTATITDLHSANGTFVNGERITTITRLTPGDEVDIGPYVLQFTGTALVPRPRSDNVELVARGVGRVVRSRETGQPQALLDDVTLVIRPREFVCLLGPSGSGKSTLLNVLSGRTAADGGTVLLNGRDLYGNFEALKQDIAVVPQKDILHEALAVGQALWYTARLRLPPDTSRAEIETTLTEMLQTVGLTARRATMIRYLSGGQVKRASLANELLCKPSLLFLDEVTSGLDEQTDREVMRLFRSLADAGKTVVCVTHSLANVERTCHLVVILTPGGKVAFVGKPAEALAYFHIDRLGDVYERLLEQPADFWQQAFLRSPFWKRYVAERLPAARPTRPAAPLAEARAHRRRSLARQTVLLTARYTAIWRGDYLSLLAMAGQALLVALLLGLLFGRLDRLEAPERAARTVNLMFLVAVSSFWFGCNNAAKEIVKERTIYSRECDFNLHPSSYYASKLLVLTACSALQAVLLFTVVRLWCQPTGSFALELMVLLGLALAGATLGLAISAAAASEEMAITLVPMAIIPQIILSGAIAPLHGLSHALALIAVSTYWGKRGLDACLPAEVAQAVPGGLEQHSTAIALLVLVLHTAASVLTALIVLHTRSRRGGSLAALVREAVAQGYEVIQQ